MVGQNCPHWRARIHCRMRVRARTKSFSAKRIFRGGIETRETTGGTQLVLAPQQRKLRYVDCYRGTTDIPNVCLPSLCFHLRRRKFSTIWPSIRMHRTPSTASFIGGCSTLTSKSGRRKLQRPSRNSSKEVFSNKSDLRMATYFTTSPRIISRRFTKGLHETLPLTQPRKPSNKKGQSCLPR